MAPFVWRQWKTEHREDSLVTPPVVSVARHSKPHLISFTFSLLVLKAALHSPFRLLSKLVLFKLKEKMSWSDNYDDYLLQQGNRNFEYSEESEGSQSSQETDSSQEHLNPWSRILMKLNAWSMSTKGRDIWKMWLTLKRTYWNTLLPLYRKELRKVLLESLQWMRAMKRDYTFKKITWLQ